MGLRRAAEGRAQLAVAAGADSDKYPPGWLFHQKWSAGKQKGPAPTLDGHRIEVIKVAGRVRSGIVTARPPRSGSILSSSLCLQGVSVLSNLSRRSHAHAACSLREARVASHLHGCMHCRDFRPWQSRAVSNLRLLLTTHLGIAGHRACMQWASAEM